MWQDRRTAGFCDELKNMGWTETIRSKTGLVIDAYFSGTKLKWLLDNVEGARDRAERGDLLFGNIDTFLIWRLTSGKVHVTDYSNASRTMLFNIHELAWDREILAELRHSRRPCCPRRYPAARSMGIRRPTYWATRYPSREMRATSRRPPSGRRCFEPGMAKNTYGTGCFMLMNTGQSPVPSKNNLLTTIGWGLNGKVTYCLEGAVFITGAAVQYLRDSLRIIENAAESEALATSVESSGGVYVVPAFVGLGAPYWDQYARGAILGLTRGSGRAEIARATLESVAYQSREVLDAMVADSGVQLQSLRVDGGMVPNNFLMQFQADILDVPVERPVVAETTALGAAYLAGLAVSYWKDTDEVKQNWALDHRFEPGMDEPTREKLYRGWKRAVQRALQWEIAEE